MLQVLLLPCWQKTPALQGDDWLKHTYTLAVSRLESAFSGRTSTILSYSEMSAKQKQKSIHSVTTMTKLIEGFLVYPTRAVQRFHPGTSLLEHWDIFNMKATQVPNDLGVETSEKGRTRPKRHPEAPAALPKTPTKKAKVAEPTTPKVDPENQRWEREKLELEGEVKEAQAKVGKSKLDLSDKDSIIDEQAKVMKGFEAKYDASEARILVLQQNIKVRMHWVCLDQT